MASEPLTFPLKWDKCPVCGSTRRVVETVKDEAAAKGKVGQDLKTALIQVQLPVIDPRKVSSQLTATILTAFIDICQDCGAAYCIEMNRSEQPINVKVVGQLPPGHQSPPPGGFPFHRGHG